MPAIRVNGPSSDAAQGPSLTRNGHFVGSLSNLLLYPPYGDGSPDGSLKNVFKAFGLYISAGSTMDIRADEIAAGIYRVSVFLPQGAGGAGFTFNHFLIVGDEPLLFHCGLRKMFPLVSGAVAKIIPLKELRWLSFGHFEADECGSMNEWLAVPPRAELMHGAVGCRVSIADMADRPPRVLSDGEVVEAASAFVISIRRMSHMAGMQASSLRRPQPRFCAATCS
jgi:hypothetical protein